MNKKICPECGMLVIPGSKHGNMDKDRRTYGKHIHCNMSGKKF